jgi:hypothetical protein
MLNIGYFKSQPNEFIIKYASGRVAREGQGLAFLYWKHNKQVVAVPTSSADANLVFNEVTRNFQAVTIQGQFTARKRIPRPVTGSGSKTARKISRRAESSYRPGLARRVVSVRRDRGGGDRGEGCRQHKHS